MNFFDHKDLGNHLLQLCPKVVKRPVYSVVTVLRCLSPAEALNLFMLARLYKHVRSVVI